MFLVSLMMGIWSRGILRIDTPNWLMHNSKKWFSRKISEFCIEFVLSVGYHFFPRWATEGALEGVSVGWKWGHWLLSIQCWNLSSCLKNERERKRERKRERLIDWLILMLIKCAFITSTKVMSCTKYKYKNISVHK